MSNLIPKINKLKKIEAFLQINYVKGFKFVDKAGEYLNALYSADEKVPASTLNPNGMVIKFSDKKEIKVSPSHVWVHFTEPDSFDEEKREILRHAQLVDDLISPEKYTRVGWRTNLVYESQSCPKIVPDDLLHGGTFDELVFNRKVCKQDARISTSFVVNKETNKKAILFDIDIFREIKIERSDFSEITRIVSEIESAYKSDELLQLLNDILAYGQRRG